MFESRKWAKIIVCGLMALFSSASFAAWTTNVTDGMTFEMTSIQGQNVQTDFNVYASYIDCSGVCTVKVLNDGGVDVRPRFRLAANTQLTLDLTARSGDGPIFSGGFIAQQGAKIVVKGDIGKFRFGRGGVGYSAFAVFDADDISFVDSSDNATTGSVRFQGSSVWVRLPAVEKVAFTFDPAARIYAYGADVLERYKNGDGDIAFSAFQLIETGHGAIPDGATVRVGAGGTFTLLHLNVTANYASISPIVDWTFTNDVEMTDSTAKFAIASRYAGDFTGTLSGSGSVSMDIYGDYSYVWDAGEKNRVTFTNPFSTSGALSLSSNKARLQLASGTSVGDFTCVDSAAVYATGTSSMTTTGTATGGNIKVERGGALTLSAANGTISISGDSRYTSSLSLAALGADGRVVYGASVAASSSVPGIHEIKTGAGGLFLLGEYDLANIDVGVTGVKTITLSGSDNTVSSLAPGYEIELADSSASARVVSDGTNSPSIRLNGGALTLAAASTVSNILNRALLWCDASAEGSWTQNIYDDNAMTYTVAYGDLKNNVYPVVEYWHDVRGAQSYAFRRLPTNNPANYISPHRVTGDWNGPYMSLDTRSTDGSSRTCRFRITRNGAAANNVAVKLVVMVFDSSPGGGKAVLGNKNGDFARANATLSAPVLPSACTDCAVWLDGEAQADPTACYFNGGWQIVTIDPGTHTISGLALPDDTNMNAGGGMNVAEILIFTEELTDTERLRVERYLAEKWGLAAQYKGGTYSNPVEARVYGAGSIALDADAALGGIYTGTVTLAGHTLDIPLCAAPTTNEVAAIANRAGWFDPSEEGSITFYQSKYGKRFVQYLNDLVLGTADDAWTIYDNSIANSVVARSDGWLDFRKGSSGSTEVSYPNGARPRLKRRPNITGTSIAPMSVRTVIMAQDSSAGGGTPLSTAVDTGDSALGRRISSSGDSYTASDHTAPIIPSSADAAYKTAAVYLDGVAVDAATRGFNGRKEVFSSVYGTDLALGVFGDYQRNTYTNALGEMQGEIIGEMLMFSRELEDSERNLVEAYLMRKWCGTVLPGYGDFTGATITGAGTVNVPSAAATPKFDSGFTGTVAFTNETLSFTIDASVSPTAAVNAIVAANGTVSLPAAVTIEAAIVPPAVAGSYTLISAGALPASLDLSLSMDAGSSGKKAFALRRTASAIVLDILPKGMIVTVR